MYKQIWGKEYLMQALHTSEKYAEEILREVGGCEGDTCASCPRCTWSDCEAIRKAMMAYEQKYDQNTNRYL